MAKFEVGDKVDYRSLRTGPVTIAGATVRGGPYEIPSAPDVECYKITGMAGVVHGDHLYPNVPNGAAAQIEKMIAERGPDGMTTVEQLKSIFASLDVYKELVDELEAALKKEKADRESDIRSFVYDRD